MDRDTERGHSTKRVVLATQTGSERSFMAGFEQEFRQSRQGGKGDGSRQGTDSRKAGRVSKHDSFFMRGNLLQYTAITGSSSPGVIKSGQLGALVSPALAKETGFYLMKLQVGSRS